MKITSAKVYEYRLPLVRPLILKSGRITEREGLLVRLTSDSGQSSWGEAASLPGFSRESLSEARIELVGLKDELRGVSIPPGLERLDGEFTRWLGHLKLCSSVQFAIEVAVLGLLAKGRGITPAGLLSDHASDYVRLNGLITDDSAIIESARHFVSHEYISIKLKVGNRTLDDDLARVRDLSRELPEDVTLRLDANRAWMYEEAARFAEAVRDCELEYIEEPLADSSRLKDLVEHTGLRVALDESLLGMAPGNLSKHDYVSAIVLKPTLLGGLEKTARFMRVAREMKITAVVSSCFESAVGIAALAQFAAAYGSLEIPVGLDTLSWFEQDLLKVPIEYSRGCIHIAQSARAADSVNESMLTEVSGG